MGASVDYKRITGVYAIEVLALKRVYVGQSVDVPNRIRQHRSVLSRGVAGNKEIQADWDSGTPFEFKLLETCYNVDLLKKETEYTLRYAKEGWRVYNSCLVSTTAFTNIPAIHQAFVYEIVNAIDSGKVTKEQIKALYK